MMDFGVPFYIQTLYIPTNDEKQSFIEKYGLKVVNTCYANRDYMLLVLKSPEDFMSKDDVCRVKDCFVNSRWMNQERFVKDLTEIKMILEAIGFPFWMQYGVLLGQRRDGRFLFWEHDIDIGSFLMLNSEDEPDWHNILMDRFKLFNEFGFELDIQAIKRYMGQRITVTKRVTTDIFLYEEYKGKYVLSDFRNWDDIEAWPKDLFDNLDVMNFSGVDFPVPKEVDRCLEMDYGPDWKTPLGKKEPTNIFSLTKEEYKELYPIKCAWRINTPNQEIIVKHMEKCYEA